MKSRKKIFLLVGVLGVGLSIVIVFAIFSFRQQWQPKELSEEEKREKEEARETRLKELWSHYFSTPFPDTESTYYIRIDWTGIDERYLQRRCRNAAFCAVVTVTKGLEEKMQDVSLVEEYNSCYGTEKKELTPEEKQSFLLEYPRYLWYIQYGGTVTMKVEEMLFNQTGEDISELIMNIERPMEEALQLCTGMRLVCFFGKPTAGTAEQPEYEEIGYWSYYLTEEDYLVPMFINVCEDIIHYGGLSLKEYKEIIREYYELSMKEKAVFYSMAKSLPEPEEGWDQEGNFIILEEKRKGKKRELYLLAAIREDGMEKTRYGSFYTVRKEGGLGYVVLEKEKESYVVSEGIWNWNQEKEQEFPERILKIAAEYGYPEGDYIENIGEDVWYSNLKQYRIDETNRAIK